MNQDLDAYERAFDRIVAIYRLAGPKEIQPLQGLVVYLTALKQSLILFKGGSYQGRARFSAYSMLDLIEQEVESLRPHLPADSFLEMTEQLLEIKTYTLEVLQ